MSAKVYDFRSRKRLPDKEITFEPPEDSTYIGHIHEKHAEVVRDAHEKMEVTADMVDDLVGRWEELALDYFGCVDKIMGVLKIDWFDPTKHEMHVGEDGHCWVTTKEEDEE